MRSHLLLFVLVVFGLIAVSGCSGQPTQSEMPLPSFLDNASATVREAYHYAMANPHELEKYPCYCGCGAMGHTSNLSCYLQEIHQDGTFTFDPHASGCGICVDITQDVMRLRGEGRSSPEIRAYIDAQYSAFGPSTNTPLPVE
jgi:hypothetical protein